MSHGPENEAIKAEPVPYQTPFRLHMRAASRAISDILGDNNTSDRPAPSFRQHSPDLDPDCVIVGTEDMPVPFGVTEDGLIKYKNDVISADIPFLPTVSI